MERQEVIENWEFFFSSMTRLVTDLKLKESTESFSVADSILTKINGSIEANIRIKDHIIRRADEESLESSDEGNIRLLLSLLENFIQYLSAQALFWKGKIDLISSQSAPLSSPSSNFISCSSQCGPGCPKFVFDVEHFECLRSIGLSLSKISEIFGISRSTLYRRLREAGFDDTSQSSLCCITDDQLDSIIVNLKSMLPHVGERIIIGHVWGCT